MEKELQNLEKYLYSTGDENIISVIKEGVEKGSLFYPGSGDTFKWVSVLRAADLHFSTQDVAGIALFRMREEGLAGDSPQIIVRCKDRYVSRFKTTMSQD
jgi:hypothetical protein